MALSNDLISQFVKINKPTKSNNVEETHNATAVVEHNGVTYVRIDGSELLTPVTPAVSVKNDDRVRVAIKNHSATIVNNISNPSASTDDIDEIGKKVTEFDVVVANKVSTEQLEAQVARIDTLQSENVVITDTLTVQNAIIHELSATNAEITGKLTAAEASIENLEATSLKADIADIKYATIESLEATDAVVTNLTGTYAVFEDTATKRLNAIDARIDNLDVGDLTVETLEATFAKVKDLEVTAGKVTNLESEFGRFDTIVTEDIDAINARIDNLDVGDLTVEILEGTFAKIENLEATDAKVDNLVGNYGEFNVLVTDKLAANDAAIDDLRVNKLSAKDLEAKYANIDFSNIGKAAIEELFTKSGLIKDLVVGDSTITGELVGVTIKGDLIEGNTIVADKLVVKGLDGLYYKLNTDGMITEAEQTDYNSLNGTVIQANSITASKINVQDLVAFDATIGGFKITDSSIYSGVKETVNNTTRGIYQDNKGQFAVGDATNYLKYYKDTDDKYKLEISADSIKMTSGDKDISETIEEITSLQIGATNLIRNSETLDFEKYSFGEAIAVTFITDNNGDVFVDENNNLFIF